MTIDHLWEIAGWFAGSATIVVCAVVICSALTFGVGMGIVIVEATITWRKGYLAKHRREQSEDERRGKR